MKQGVLIVLTAMLIFALALIPLACQDEQAPPEENTTPEVQCSPPNWTVKNETEFLALAEQCNLSFSRYDTGDYGFSYSYYRKIGNISVWNNKVTYLFYKNGGFREKIINWREGLPSEPPEILISEQEAIRIAGGVGNENDYANLYYIEKCSYFDYLEETPENPVWLVRTWKEGCSPSNYTSPYDTNSLAIDAITGEVLGHGIILW